MIKVFLMTSHKSLFNDISYSEAMSNLHGIIENGEIIRGLDVLAYSYIEIGIQILGKI